MTDLELTTLGTLEVRHGGRLVSFATRKTSALLIFLAVEGGLHSREKLTALFWPESDDARARGALRSTMTFLRSSLADGGALHLHSDRERVGVTGITLDVRELHAAFALARAPHELPLTEQMDRLQRAAERWRGDFLTGFSLEDAPDFDDWTVLQREHWRQRADVVLDRLSQLQWDSGDPTAAVDTARRWVALDALNEAAHRRLMQVLFAAGDRAGALRAWEACRTILAEELNAEPAPDTAALGERLRKLPMPSRDVPIVDEPAIPVVTVDAPLVGRGDDHARLVDLFRRARRGTTHVVLLEGEAGIGKSRLGRELLTWAGAQGAETLSGRALESSARLPYQPIAAALRERLAREPDPRALLADIWLAELGRLLPELYERLPDLPRPTSGDDASRGRLFESAVRLGSAFAERAPLVWLVDDLQWADAATLDLLSYAIGSWTSTGTAILLVLAARAEELTAESAVNAWLSGLQRDPGVTRVDLGPLDHDALRRLAATLRGDGTSDESTERFASWLLADTGGQPLFVVETLRALYERSAESGWHAVIDAAMSQSDVARDVAPRVQEIVRGRVNRLAPPARGLLSAAAVLGDGATFEQIGAVASAAEDEGLDALDELLARRLLRETDARYQFTHDRIREVVYADAGDARRRVLHRRAFEQLQAADAPPGELARHALAAGLASEAFRLYVAAGDAAMRVFAVRDSITAYRVARDLAPGLPPSEQPSAEEWRHLALQFGRAFELTADYEAAREIYLQLRTVSHEQGDAAAESDALNRLAALETTDRMDFEAHGRLLTEALAVATAGGYRAGQVEAEWNLARLLMFRSDFPGSLSHFEHALTLARDIGDDDQLGRILVSMALAEVQWGDHAAVLSHAGEARDIFRRLGNQALESDALVQFAEASLRIGRPRDALEMARRAWDISSANEIAWGLADAAKDVALALAELGQYEEALEFIRKGAAKTQTANYGPLTIIVTYAFAIVHRAAGQLDAAHAALLQLRGMAQQIPYSLFTEMAESELCIVAGLRGDWDAAAEHARRAIGVRDYGMLFTGMQRWCETSALLRAGEVDLALDDGRRFSDRVGANPRYGIAARRCEAEIAHWRGDLPGAIEQLRQALALATDIGLPGETWSIHAGLAEVLSAAGDSNGSREHTDRAREIVDTLAARFTDVSVSAAFLALAERAISHPE